MDIGEIYIERKKFESEIRDALESFSDRTGVYVADIRFDLLDSPTMEKPDDKTYSRVQVDIVL